MNVDLAMTALDGIARSPITIAAQANEIVISGSPASLKELARLCLLVAADADDGDYFELQRNTHLTGASPALRVKVSA